MAYKLKTNVDTDSVVEIPKMFAVIMHNDDYTSQEFVVQVLVQIFKKNIIDATNIMMTIHTKGKCLVDVYVYDIAITKKMQTHNAANKNGFPLKITVEEAIG